MSNDATRQARIVAMDARKAGMAARRHEAMATRGVPQLPPEPEAELVAMRQAKQRLRERQRERARQPQPTPAPRPPGHQKGQP